MTVYGIGVDLLHVPRMTSLLYRRGTERVALRILSPSEQYVFGRLAPETRSRFLGVRWAVKEAAYKALYPLKPTWKELTYTSFDPQSQSKPTLVCHAFDGQHLRLHASVSHDGEYILAHVVAENMA